MAQIRLAGGKIIDVDVYLFCSHENIGHCVIALDLATWVKLRYYCCCMANSSRAFKDVIHDGLVASKKSNRYCYCQASADEEITR